MYEKEKLAFKNRKCILWPEKYSMLECIEWELDVGGRA